LYPGHPPSGDDGYRKRVDGHSAKPSARRVSLLLATAATRWSDAKVLYPGHPPSGDGGYRKK
ncbi:MAG: hypothetical protein ACK57Y_08580, partial [Pirellulaceae bacterium]